MSWSAYWQMVTPRPWACRQLRPWPLAILAVVIAACHHTPPPPTLAAALRFQGTPTQRANALVQVALEGSATERHKAWFLAGLYACDAGAPVPAATYFTRAGIAGGLTSLAARRLEEALGHAPVPDPASTPLVGAPFLSPDAAVRLQLTAAEVLVEHGRDREAMAALPPLDHLQGSELGRALALAARAQHGDRSLLARRVLLDVPQAFARLFPGESPATFSRTFSAEEWARHARAWLDAGDLGEAVRSGRRGGPAGALVAARASLRARHSSAALAELARVESSAAVWLERAEAYRQIAWGSQPPHRGARFADMLRASQQAARLASQEGPDQARAALQEAEALIELGHLERGAVALRRPGCAALPRFDWVLRRLLLRSASSPAGPEIAPEGVGSGRVQRLGAYWRGVRAARVGDSTVLEKLVREGPPDLPTLWACQAMGRPLPAMALSASPPSRQAPPPWSRELLLLGRTADVAVAWRADLESGRAPAAGWLGLAALTKQTPLESIPMLIKGEPRLLNGPWGGLPVNLLEQYLPLFWRRELEHAASRASIPPWVLAGLVRQESAWNPRARSAANALGLAQVLPNVGREAGSRAGVRVVTDGDLFDPAKNLAVGAWLLASWRRSFGGAWTPALASYNAGERRVREVWERCGRRDGPGFVEAIEIPETWDYVHRVVFLAEGYRIVYWPEGKAFPWTS